MGHSPRFQLVRKNKKDTLNLALTNTYLHCYTHSTHTYTLTHTQAQHTHILSHTHLISLSQKAGKADVGRGLTGSDQLLSSGLCRRVQL